MTFVITSACVDVRDRSCIEVCPVDCIHFEEVDRMCYIDPDTCIDCAVCVSACPVAAIFDETELVPEDKPYQAINALWFADKDAARAQVEEERSSAA